MQAGKLNQRLALYQRTEGKTPSGAPTVTLRKQAMPWAELIESKAASVTANDRTVPQNAVRWRLRWRSVLGVGDWIAWRGTWYKVEAVDRNDPKRQQLFIDVVESADPPPDVEG